MAKKSHIFRNIIFILLILIIGIGLGVGVFLFKNNLSSNQYDEDNVGEIYYQGIDEEHVASIDDYMSYTDNEVLVVANDDVSYSKMENLVSSYNATIVGYIEQTGDYQLELNDTYTVDELEELIKQLENEDIIDSASINYITEISEDTINYGNEWSEELESLDNSGKGWNLKLANVLSAWDTLDRQNQDTINPVRIGLIDSGFDTTQEDLGFAEVFYNENLDSSNYSHGTHVAGIMAAKSNNDEGICGVYPYGDGNLYGVSTTGVKNNSENNVSTMAYKIAFAELIFRNVKVINVSQGYNWYLNKEFSTYLGDTRIYTDYQDLLDFWQTYDFSGYEEDARCLGDFLNRTLEKGFDFVIVCSAGNDSDTSIGHLESRYASSLNLISEDDYPDVYNRIIVVGSIDRTSEAAYYSNGGDRVDIYAPGGEESSNQSDKKMIYSTLPDNDYGYMFGTSQAAPLVSGVAGMVWSVYNELTGEEVKETLISSASTYNDVLVVDASDALSSVLMTSKFTELSTADYGGILCFVVNSENEDERISEATVIAKNKDTGESETTTTDTFGHFELILTEGQYILTVNADGYEEYTIDTVEVKAAGVNYLDDWIKMTPIDENSTNSGNIASDAVEYNGHYYMIFTGTQTWSEAKEICEGFGGHLATITSQEEQDFIEEYNTSSSYLWIGGYREDDGDTWMWVTGEDWNYENWGSDEPNNSSNVVANENRIVLWSDCSWNDLNDENTSESNGYICEWDGDVVSGDDETYESIVEQEEAEYSQLSEYDKCAYCVDKIINAINNKDYDYLYDHLDPVPKNNYYPTQESFVEFIESNFYEKNTYTLSSSSWWKVAEDNYQFDNVYVYNAFGNIKESKEFIFTLSYSYNNGYTHPSGYSVAINIAE